MEDHGATRIFAEFLYRRTRGDAVDITEFCRLHPEHEPELRDLNDEWLRVASSIRGKDDTETTTSADPDPGLLLVPPEPLANENDVRALFDRLTRRGPPKRRFVVKERIGRGGMGTVFRVFDADLGRHVAAKVLHLEDPGHLSRFLEEAQITGQLDHPVFVPVHGVERDEKGRVFFTMKLVKGTTETANEEVRAETLLDVIEKIHTGHEGWNVHRCVSEVIVRVAEAMEFAHRKGVVHRDLKPANILVGRYGEVYVTDFGIARVQGRERAVVDSQTAYTEVKTVRRSQIELASSVEFDPESPISPGPTMEGASIGTAEYMPLEQAEGRLSEIGPASDVYSLGATLYHVIAGLPPWHTPSDRPHRSVIVRRMIAGARRLRIDELVPNVPDELAAIVEKAMQREPTRRYPDMHAFANDLRAFLEGRVVRAHATGVWAETTKWLKRNRAIATATAAAFLAMAIGAASFRARAIDAAAAATTARRQLYETSVIGAASARQVHEAARMRRFLDSAPVELRNWEWRYLDAQSDRSRFVLVHDGPVNSAECDPSGKYVLTASNDHTARIWELRTGIERLRLVGHTWPVRSAKYSPNGGLVVTASSDGTARIFETRTGTTIHVLQASSMEPSQAEGPSSPTVTDAAFDSTGRKVVTSASDGTTRVWNVEDGKEIRKWNSPGDSPYFDTLFWLAPRDSRIVLGSIDLEGSAQVWDPIATSPVCKMAEWFPNAIDFHPDGKRLVSASQSTDLAVIVWDATTGLRTQEMKGHKGSVLDVAFSPDGATVVSASADKTARIWSTETGTELESLNGHDDYVNTARFSPDGRLVVTTSNDHTVRIWYSKTGFEMARLEGHRLDANAAFFSPCGAFVVTASDDCTARIWAVDSCVDPLRLDGHTSTMNHASFSPDGSRVVTAGQDGTARIWDATTGHPLARLDAGSKWIECATFDSNGSRIVTSTFGGRVDDWDAGTGEPLESNDFEHKASYIAFSPDGRYVFDLSGDGTTVRETSTGRDLVHVELERHAPASFPFSADSRRVIVESPNGAICVWDLATRKMIYERLPNETTYFDASLSTDGSTMVVTDENRARVIDVDSGMEIACLEGHTDYVRPSCFSPDGSRIATGSWDGTVRVWDSRSGVELARLEVGGHVHFICFSPDGSRLLAVAGYDALIWDTVPRRERLMDREKTIAARAEGERVLDALLKARLTRTEAGARLRTDSTLDPWVRKAALDVLLERAQTERDRPKQEAEGAK